MKKLTQDQFRRMSGPEKTQAYFNHSDNQSTNNRGEYGPSMTAQSTYVNDWQRAFNTFESNLPRF